MPSTTFERPARGWSPGRVAAAVVVVALVSMWVYVLYLAFGPGRQPPPDRLADPAFATAAQERCAEALSQVARLPRAGEVDSAAERSRVVSEANGIFTAMVDDLEDLAPEGEDGNMVHEWVRDWRTYLQDRQAYATALRDDPAAHLFVSVRDNQQITEYLDAFAADNKITACATPIDV